MPTPRGKLWRHALRPRPGRRLPEELRYDRVAGVAERLREGVRGQEFRELVERIDDSAFVSGTELEVYSEGPLAFRAMRAAIDEAQREVLVETYILEDDETGRELLAALAQARARGAVVRVLADAFGSSQAPASFWREMRTLGIAVHRFRQPFARVWYQPFRDHRKLLVTDRRVAFTGGMNLANEYSGADGRRSWRDTHIRAEGSVAREMALVFAEGWWHATGEELHFDPDEVSAVDGAVGRPSPEVLVLDSRPRRGHRESASTFAALVAATRERLWITNAYFAPRRSTLDLLADAVGRGVDVRLLLPAKSDVPVVRHAGHGSFATLLRAGVSIFEYEPRVLHAKTLVADGFASVVGSSNLDVRSFRLNAECNLVILDERVGSHLETIFTQDLAHAAPIAASAWQSRALSHRLLDGAAAWLTPLL